MRLLTAVLVLALAVLILPAAAAQAVNVEAPVVDSLVETIDGVVPLDTSRLLDDGTALVEDTTGISLRVVPPQPEAVAEPAAVDVPEREPSIGEQVADVAAPAAGSALIGLALGFLAFGLEGLRVLQMKASGLAVRLLRGAAGLLLAIPLFSRIERHGVLENPVRARVHDVVAQEPGLSLSEVGSRAGIAWGTTVHHLRRLEAHGLVVSVRELAHRRFFVANTPAAAQRSAVAVVMHPTARRIAEFVAQRPGTDQAGICLALGLNNPATSKHLTHFERQGLILSQRSGRSRLYHATGDLHSTLQLLEPASVRVHVSAAGQAFAGTPVARTPA